MPLSAYQPSFELLPWRRLHPAWSLALATISVIAVFLKRLLPPRDTKLITVAMALREAIKVQQRYTFSSETLSQDIADALNRLCDILRAAMQEAYGQELDFRVSVRCLVDKERLVVVGRDNGPWSGDAREIREYHSISGNTDADTILSGRQEVFASDNLTSEVEYKNTRARWSDSFNACIVFPIRSELMTDGKHEILGTLSIDTIKPKSKELFTHAGKPDGKLAFVLQGFADLIFGLFKYNERANASRKTRMELGVYGDEEAEFALVRTVHQLQTQKLDS